MDLLDFSIAKSISVSSPKEPSFQIFQDEPLHDKAIDQLQKYQIVTLKSLSSLSLNGEVLDQETISTVRFISDSMNMHNQLSKMPPGSLAIFDKKSTAADGSCFLEILRVARVTGDLCVKIVGQYIDVLELIQYFVPDNELFTISLLVPSQTSLNSPVPSNSFHISITESPYLLAPGSIMKIQSPDMNILISAIMQILFSKQETMDRFDSLYYNRPLSSGLITVDAVNLNVNNIVHDQSRQESREIELPVLEKVGYKLIQLTRPEVTFLIGKHGNKIQEIRRRSNATVKVIPLNSEMNADLMLNSRKRSIQFIRVSGTKKQIQEALHIIESDIYQFRNGGITTY